MLQSFFNWVFDDAPWTARTTETYVNDVFSDLLSYRVYDPDKNLFHNEGSVGFLLETPPKLGQSDIASLQSAISTYCPEGGTVQFLNWTSPNLEHALGPWLSAKPVQSPLTAKILEHRTAHLKEMSFGAEGLIKCVPHLRRVFIAGWVDDLPTSSSEKALEEFRRNLITALGGPDVTRDVPPSVFLDLINEITHARGNRFAEPSVLDPETPLNYQFPGAGLRVDREGMDLLNTPEMAVSCATVRRVPETWSFAMGALFNGSPETPEDRPHGPVLTSLVARAIPQATAANELMKKSAKIAHSEGSAISKYMPGLSERGEEIRSLALQLEQGERLFETATVVCAYARGSIEESRAALAEMTKIYREAGLALEQDSFLQLPVFLAALPFQASRSILRDLQKSSRVKRRKGAAVAALAPLHGEWMGGASPSGIPLVGRQGQLFLWDPFESTGNYNVAVTGKSGSGKSVLMQELITNIFMSGGRALVIDDGESFKNTCDMLGGSWLGLSAGSRLKLNPFSMLDARQMEDEVYRSDAIVLLTSVIATMAQLGEQREGRVVGVEEDFIQAACFAAWEEKGLDAEVSDVVRFLEAKLDDEPRLKDVIYKLGRYCPGQLYGSIFQGRANVSINSAFTVFEMRELKSHPDLQAVVLQLIMFLGSELMFSTDRDVRVAILIDEAWDMLGGPGTAAFLQGLVRRVRKYNGSLITGTQSLHDYHSSPAAKVCLDNSDFKLMLAQNPEVIDGLVAEKKLEASPGILFALKRLISVPGGFSEMAIKTPEGWAFGRLVVDPYSLAIYSSRAQTVQRLKQLREIEGLDLPEALEALVKAGGVL